MAKPNVTIVGGGMITHDQLLPTVYHLQREGEIGDISVCALNARPLKDLASSAMLREAFPGQDFTPCPDPRKVGLDDAFPDLFKEAIARMSPRNLVVVAVPDHLHYGVLKVALEHDQHVCCVKPLVLTHGQAMEIEKLARTRGLFVGVDYHKRFDDRNLIARERYRAGEFGQFRLGQARLMEPWYYRESNFQNWCTCENSDFFTYVGCHYVDLVAFITGLLPAAVSVYGIVDEYPNGNKGYLWTDGRVIWENGACLDVQNAIGYPNEAPGGNSQGMLLFCQGKDRSGVIEHSDAFRGVKHSLAVSDTGRYYTEPNPDYFRLVHKGGKELTPVGYGHRSVEQILRTALGIERATASLGEKDALKTRQKMLAEIDAEGIRETTIRYGKNPGVDFRTKW
jgi:predicted dehydrogenase